jgi:pSer/pThr/pTyr-binding forkhead associated (FHA) protein
MPILLRVRTVDGVTPWLSFDAERIVIGRSAGSDLRLPDVSVALRHAVITFDKRNYVLSDEGTKSGTYVGDNQLSPRAPQPIKSGDKLRFGRILIDVSQEPLQAETSVKAASRRIAYQLVEHAQRVLGEPHTVRMVVVSGPDAGEELRLADGDQRYLIGRGEHCHLVLRDPNVSREHVELRRVGDLLQLYDAGSRGGMKLGGESVPAGRAVTWRPSVHLAIGSTLIGLDDPVVRALDALDRGDEVALTADEEALFLHTELAEENSKANSATPAAALGRTPASRAGDGGGSTGSHRDPAAESLPLLQQVNIALPATKPEPSRQNEWTIALLAVLVLTVSGMAIYWLGHAVK